MVVMMNLRQIIRGRTGQYTITKQLHESVWLAKNQENDSVIVKCANHFRIHNERDVLLRFQHKTPILRPLLDEIQDPASLPAIVLRYLEGDILHASNRKRLARAEVKYIARHIKPSNVLVNYGIGEPRFKEVQLADFGSTAHLDSAHARDGDSILISLLYGEGFHIFKPDVPVDHEDYDLKILMKHHQCFGPFPASYDEIANLERRAVLIWVMQNCHPNTMRPFRLTTSQEICNEEKESVLKVMKFDPRDRHSAKELLEDSWFVSGE
ncbi:kinase-like protein [Penicillium malachiteum]|uniref:kinase-like protein n=1 Tax=Penicillium malachiteum TaxID=1324776 RepID=UPI00254883B5|nr:kinase-like protein [Penicillium malachiteum]KAJ5735151.1 kinase-like protein [Penicillium malachiteum]